MHSIQEHILRTLMNENPARYSSLRPPAVEGNVFTYHLGQALKKGLVEKQGEKYGLTRNGKQFIDSLSSKDYKPRVQPKIVVDVACKNEKGEWLLFERAKEPFAGLIGFPSGKLHLGELTQEAAKRELLDKTGYVADVTPRGELYVSIFQDGEVENHLLVHTFTGTITGGELKSETPLGRAFWGKIDDPFAAQYFKGFGKLIELIETREERFFEELVFTD